MGRLKDGPVVVALIGDVVESKKAPDRRRLHERLVQTLSEVSQLHTVRQPLAITVGDEFQGVFDTLGEALAAALRVRLALLPDIDVRIGLGRGQSETLDPERGIQDGSAWWAARAAIESVEQRAEKAATRLVRTAYRAASGREGAGDPAVTAALECRDHMIGSLSERSRRLLGGLMDDATQAELAAQEGISSSAVSQRVRADGLMLIVDASRALGSLS